MNDVLAALITVPLQTEGIFDWVNEKNASAMAAARGLSITIAIIFLLVTAARTKLAAAPIIIAGIIAAIFVWIVFNVTKLDDRVDTEMSSGPVSSISVAQTPPR